MNIVNVCVFFLVVSDENKNREKMKNYFSNFVALGKSIWWDKTTVKRITSYNNRFAGKSSSNCLKDFEEKLIINKKEKKKKLI